MNKNKIIVFFSFLIAMTSGLIFAEHRLTQRQQDFIWALDDAQDMLHEVGLAGKSIENIVVAKVVAEFLDKSGKMDDELRSSASLLDFTQDGHHKIIEFLLEQGVGHDEAAQVIFQIITNSIPECIEICEVDGMDFTFAQYFLDEYIAIGKSLVKFGVFDPQSTFKIESFQLHDYAPGFGLVDLSEYPMEITLNQLVDALIVSFKKDFALAIVRYQVANELENVAAVQRAGQNIITYLKKFQQEVLV